MVQKIKLFISSLFKKKKCIKDETAEEIADGFQNIIDKIGNF